MKYFVLEDVSVNGSIIEEYILKLWDIEEVFIDTFELNIICSDERKYLIDFNDDDNLHKAFKEIKEYCLSLNNNSIVGIK